MATAHSHVFGVATASMTTSAPRASGVKLRTSAITSSEFVQAYDLARAKSQGQRPLILVLDYGDDMDSIELSDVHEHETDGARANDYHRISGASAGLFQTADNAGQRLSERGVLEWNSVGHEQGVLLDDARGDAHVLGIRAVVEDQVLAQILLALPAPEAEVAGGGVQRHHAVSDVEAGHAGARFDDLSGELVAKGDWRLEHHGVVAAAIDFEVGAAGEGGADAKHELAPGSSRNGHTFHAQVLAAIEDSRQHRLRRALRNHPSIFSLPTGGRPSGLAGWTLGP